jgi:hypothetical protein
MFNKSRLIIVILSMMGLSTTAVYLAGPASANAAEVWICGATSYSGITGLWQCANVPSDKAGTQVNFIGENAATENDAAPPWHAPTSGYGQISIATGAKYCMSLDYGNDNNAVKLGACVGATNEEWLPKQLSNGSWVFYNKAHKTYCLNYDSYPIPPVMNAVACPKSPGNNQQFYVGIAPGSG